MVRGIIKHD